jgi:hypothetical protein
MEFNKVEWNFNGIDDLWPIEGVFWTNPSTINWEDDVRRLKEMMTLDVAVLSL